MKHYVTVDCGTTNTRVFLVSAGEIRLTKKIALGARACRNDKTGYSRALGRAIREVISDGGLTEADVTRILASGMITSELGLAPLAHLLSPAGIAELKAGMVELELAEVSPIPFAFVRGVRNDSEELSQRDMMRGEETELMGLSEGGEESFLLMGSHSKLVSTDSLGRISGIHTLMTGELIEAVASDTVLKEAVNLYDSELSEADLFEGYDLCESLGLGEALFKVRVASVAEGATAERAYGLYMGIMLHGDAECIRREGVRSLCIGGNERLATAIALLLDSKLGIRVRRIGKDEAETAVARGLVRIYEYKRG